MGRLLHYVYKIPHRGESVKFYRELGMKSLRHEEFTEGCEAQVRKPRLHLRVGIHGLTGFSVILVATEGSQYTS